ncbi:penicillin-binding protein 2 [Roseivirga pacifica]|uniref:penicillin-binding protein 2 n=1 Tax=Roseivirga pacifica TaxID=1267423 RepID=UPI0020960590|nr:penicillin-binding protein 2 [Roseivirga pacifica]MCO6359454.1 penicillin-binding protein 2 [Roseivirga pacifica]MCO6366824.1 penicillin-binding protein 2 [Roseivirga pacifica]MCO6370644.1 penicillin-binding protein 2 [Roseivirga pacifica]MCO6374480.1 penicillin-binding protein 2 [Roseivirga pacifica]MCO6379739.1 penicillin-binding protein 2 [Roseivirga pacifica]
MFENRRYIIQAIFIGVGLVFLVKLFALQVADDTYHIKAERNIIHRIIEYPFRGLMYDRNDELIVYNEPIYDLMVVPRDVYIADTADFCNLFKITEEDFLARMQKARKYSSVKPSAFLQKISHEEFALIQDHLYKFNGFYANPRTIRKYSQPLLANEIGYTGEISPKELERDTTGYYKSGDYVGVTGLEKYYEEQLRGVRGVSRKVVNVNGIEKGSFKNGEYDTAAVPGKNLITTIDLELQAYAEKLLAGKRGSVVAIEPSTGEVLVMASAPSYDPNLLTGREFGKNFKKIESDTTSPLFNRAIQAQYPPGSIFKTVQALIALDEGVISADEAIMVYNIHMGDHAPSGKYDVTRGIENSSNNYFYEVMRRTVNQGLSPSIFTDTHLGMEKWARAVEGFGFGSPLGIDIKGEAPGLVPDTEFYHKMYPKEKGSWAYSTIYSLSIGQGELLVTPLQVANLAATIANRGYYIKPHLVSAFKENGVVTPIEYEKHYTGKGDQYYPAIIEGMKLAVEKTAPRALIKDIPIAGKTGTAENGVKNESLDHSVFMAFAPADDPKIAIAVYTENAGWGGGASASIASLIIEKYIRGEIKKTWWNREEYVLKKLYLKGLEGVEN